VNRRRGRAQLRRRRIPLKCYRFAETIRGSLIVSCQADPDHPLRDSPTIARLALVAALTAALPVALVVAEGRYHRPEHVRAALDAGSAAVVVGTAITDPAWITATFAASTGR
jgi:putative N-acetylmannosamine-6-phosphate epimerase